VCVPSHSFKKSQKEGYRLELSICLLHVHVHGLRNVELCILRDPIPLPESSVCRQRIFISLMVTLLASGSRREWTRPRTPHQHSIIEQNTMIGPPIGQSPLLAPT
jgi:hypothetical protein